MKKLIELFNKKYGATYGIIDDSIDNEDVYKVYKIIKTLCSDDKEIMDVLNKVKLPRPKTATESIEKININVESGADKEYLNEQLKLDKEIREKVEHKIGHITNEKLVFEYDVDNPPEGSEIHNTFYTIYSDYFKKRRVFYNYNLINIDTSKIKTDKCYKVVINDEILHYVFYNTDWALFNDLEIFTYNPTNFKLYHVLPNKTDNNDFTIEVYNREKSNCLKISTDFQVEDENGDIVITEKDIDYEFKNIKFYELTLDNNEITYGITNGGYNFEPKDNSVTSVLQHIGSDYELKLDMDIVVNNLNPWNKDLITFFNSQNLIVDYGDGIVEELINVTKITYKYKEKGKYSLRVYSNEYLNIKEIQGTQINYAEFNKLDLSQHTRLERTFPYYCNINCDISITDKCTYMSIPFCTQFIDNLDFVDFSNITALNEAFNGMISLTHFPENANTAKVKNWDFTFQDCKKLKRIDSLDMSSATSCNGTFYDTSLEYICPISIPNCRNIDTFCENSYNLKHLNITTNNLTNINTAFCWCFDLKTIQTLDLGNINTRYDAVDKRYYYIDGVFKDCQSLEYVKLSGTIPATTLEIVLNHLPKHEDDIRRVVDISLCDNKADVNIEIPGWEISKEEVEYWGEGVE